MRAFGRIESTFWQNPKVRDLSEPGRLLLLYVYSCPHANSLGCFVLPDGYIAADMEWVSERVTEHVSELVSKGFIERDSKTSLTRVCGWFGHNTFENANVAKAAIKMLRLLPRGIVFDNLINDLNAFNNSFLNPLLNEFRNELPNSVRPEPEPKPEPDKESRRPRRLKQSLSPDVAPDETDLAYAKSHGVDPSKEWPRFVDWHLKNGVLVADIHAAWRTWVRKAQEFAAQKPPERTSFKEGRAIID